MSKEKRADIVTLTEPFIVNNVINFAFVFMQSHISFIMTIQENLILMMTLLLKDNTNIAKSYIFH